MLITAYAGFSRGVALRSGILLGQGSEFGFAVLTVAITTGLLDLDTTQPITAAIILSMALSPLLIRHNRAIADRFAPDEATVGRNQLETRIEQAVQEMRDHVLLCGFGRTAQNLSQFLKREGIPFVALEIDTDIVTEAREAGEPVYFGNSGNPGLLRAAGIDGARVLVISFTDIKAAEHIAQTVRALRPDIPMIVRTLDDRHLERLLDCGADEVIPDTVESSMMLARHTLEALGQDPAQIENTLSEARAGHYARVRAYFHSIGDIDLRTPDHHHLHSVEVLSSYHAVGHAIAALKCLANVRIISLRRNGVSSEDPVLETPLEPGDVLVIEGHPDEIQAAEIEIMSGL